MVGNIVVEGYLIVERLCRFCTFHWPDVEGSFVKAALINDDFLNF